MRLAHPIAEIFPLMTGAALDELARDIGANGLREPIILHPDGRILDGRNRYEACRLAGVEPSFLEWSGEGSAVSYVVSLNLHRRHLDESQRALVAAKLANLSHGQRADRVDASIEASTQPEAAKLLNVSRPSVQRARTVLEHGTPELVQAVERGDVAVSAAAVVAANAEPSVQRELVAEGGKAVAAAAKAHVSFNSGNNEWYTPAHLLDLARDVMGGIDCDPASSDIANATVKAKQFFTAETDGLKQERWGKRVWLNPPNAQPLIQQFIENLAERVQRGEVQSACVLVNNATETAWAQTLLAKASSVCLLRGRVRFLDPEGNASGAPLQGQMLAYIGNARLRFADKCMAHGSVWLARG